MLISDRRIITVRPTARHELGAAEMPTLAGTPEAHAKLLQMNAG
jgi:hypothetical protein